MSAKSLSRATAARRRIEEAAREHAEDQARRIVWPRFLAIQEQYLDSQEFYFWMRSIIDSEGCVPPFLASIVELRRPGFQQQLSTSDSNVPLPLRLWNWIDEQSFGQMRREGWFGAIEYFTVRHPRYQRAQACWLKCIEEWRAEKPRLYPSFEEWRHLAAACEPEDVPSPEAQRAWTAFKRVSSERLNNAVSAYLDWQAFAYWVRSALDSAYTLPPDVERALEKRCPGFLLSCQSARTDECVDQQLRSWNRLLRWVHEHIFADAKTEQWLDAILFCVKLHPRSMRTADFWFAWDRRFSEETIGHYPSFDQWCHDVDTYVEAGSS